MIGDTMEISEMSLAEIDELLAAIDRCDGSQDLDWAKVEADERAALARRQELIVECGHTFATNGSCPHCGATWNGDDDGDWSHIIAFVAHDI